MTCVVSWEYKPEAIIAAKIQLISKIATHWSDKCQINKVEQ